VRGRGVYFDVVKTTWEVGSVAGHFLAVAVMQGALWCLARLLRRPLDRSVVVAGLLLSHVVLAPWFAADRVLLPTVAVEQTFPGSPRLACDLHHKVLNDGVFQFVPWESEVRAALRDARLPLWTDRIDGGSSLWANPQAQVLSPVKMLARLVPIEDSLVTAMVLTMLVAFEGTWLAARLFGAAPGVALLAACGFALGGGTMAWSILPNSSTVAWAPWLVGAVLRLVRRPQWRYLLAASLVTAVLAVSGHPETAAAAGLLAVVCGLALGRRAGGRLRGVGAAALAAALGLGVAAPLVLPFTHSMLGTSRVGEINPRPMPRKQFEWNVPKTWFVGETQRILLQPANPNGAGTPYVDESPTPVPWPVTGSLYCGIALFLGAVVALVQRRRRTIPLFVFGAVGCFLAVRPIPVEWILLSLPGVKVIHFNRILPVVALCFCLAGALGLGRFLSGRWGRVPVLAAVGAAATSVVIAPSVPVVVLWTLLFAALFVARWQPRVGLAATTFVVLVDLVPWAQGMLPVGRRELFYPPTAVTEEMARQTSRDGPWRVVGAGTAYYPSSLAMYELEDVRYHNPMVSKAYARVLSEVFGFHERRGYFSEFRVTDHPLLDFLNVRVVVKRGRGRIPPGLVRPRSPVKGVRLATNRGALRRFFVAPSAEVVARDDVLASVVALADARRVVIAAEDVGEWLPPERPWMPAAVRVAHLSQGDIELTVPRRGQKLLATSLTVPEGWKATADNRPLKTLTVNGAFLAVVVPDGVKAVRLRFIPTGLWLGFVLCMMSIGTLVVLAFIPRRTVR